MSDFSDLDDDDLVELLEAGVNRCVETTVRRHNLPVQRDLVGNILKGEKSYYEEIKTTVTYKPTHHQLCYEKLGLYVYPTNYEVRDYQFEIVKRALFENVLCAIPTGMGKTFIASTVMLNYYNWTKTSKIIFTAPTRPLVAQQIKACLGITGLPYSDTAILLDKSRKHREQIWAEKRVFFATPQVIENDLKRGALNPNDIVLLVIDEAHRARGSYAYVEVAKFIDRFNTSYRTLALTATPAADLEGVQEVVENLHISKIELRTEESEDIRKYMKRRDTEKVNVPLLPEIEDIIEQLGIAITPVLNEAVQLGIFDRCEPTYINAFVAMQQSQKVLMNPSLPEGVKWRNYFILQLLCHVGHMLKRLKIYGIQTFYTYFDNKFREFTTKYGLGKSTNKTAASFYYSSILKNVIKSCQRYISNPAFLGHGKLQCVRDRLEEFLSGLRVDSRVIIFTELRESALELVKCIDDMNNRHLRPHIFIGQSRGKEGFDDSEYIRKFAPKGRTKAERLRRLEEEKEIAASKLRKLEFERQQRSTHRTATSEEAQITGMTQKQQKDVLDRFKRGEFNVLVCTSIGEEGLDIGEVDMIICYDTTSSPIKNIQRMGRTGRKRDGKIVLLLSANESNKFEKAMEDYRELQKLISRDSLEYKVSDRIIPKEFNPECQKEFINISTKNNEVNTMEDTDSVIKFATKAMLGKLDSKQKGRVKPVKAASKRFFMPQNVDIGIIPAMKLVKKHKLNQDGQGTLNHTEVKKRKVPENEETLLDRLEYDSLDSEFSSPEKMSQGPIADIKPKLLSNVFCKQEISATDHITSSQLSSLKLNSDIIANDSCSPPVSIKRSPDSSPRNSQGTLKLEPIYSHSPPSLYKKRFEKQEGLLTLQERCYFQENYSNLNLVTLEPIPRFIVNNKSFRIPHTARVQSLINIFSGLESESKENIIEMNRLNALSRRIVHCQNEDSSSQLPCNIIVHNDNIILDPIFNKENYEGIE
ncbi:HDR009Cp [Eremothecium sinecaudum]|uniref:ATP-dependent DNA helicase n=1 Tax=Eremothecium sinecaudum TaxID=45286 RepID=A0A0X8HSL5_9SACH|nr:HDR009Cp [Eremothecium sinecaudum]AMD20752.1 HDR009Cp [Eremothecium sinecaudum]